MQRPREHKQSGHMTCWQEVGCEHYDERSRVRLGCLERPGDPDGGAKPAAGLSLGKPT